MLKLLIVEDERWEREGLQDFLDWSRLGIGIPALACDGLEGIELARKIRPDIIITDIKMPGLDGLKMSGRIREFLPDVKIIVLTGYDDFRLAQEAIRINAYAYILKPVEEQELYQVMERMAEDCKKTRKREEEVLRLKEQKEENDKIVANIFLLDLLKGRYSKDALKRQASCHRLPQEGSCFVLALKDGEKQSLSPAERDIAKAEELLAASPLFSSTEHVQLLHTYDSASGILYLCVFPSIELPEGEGISIFCEMLIRALFEGTGRNPVVGAGKPVHGLNLLEQSCLQAEEALEFVVFTGRRAIAFEELEKNQIDYSRKIPEFMTTGNYYNKQLLHALKSGDEERIGSLLEELFGVIRANAVLGRETIANYLYGLVNEAGLIAYNTYRETGEDAGKDTAGVQILSLLTLNEMKEFVYHYMERVLDQFRVQRSKKDERMVKKVEELILAKYTSDINLKTISSEVYLSPNYLGSIFKKMTGQSFNDYLGRIRMEKAKELLTSPKNKVSYVASAVGIPNTSYFCVLFKNAYGVAPGEYQESVIRGRLG